MLYLPFFRSLPPASPSQRVEWKSRGMSRDENLFVVNEDIIEEDGDHKRTNTHTHAHPASTILGSLSPSIFLTLAEPRRSEMINVE
jgi:hypothetical protein